MEWGIVEGDVAVVLYRGKCTVNQLIHFGLYIKQCWYVHPPMGNFAIVILLRGKRKENKKESCVHLSKNHNVII